MVLLGLNFINTPSFFLSTMSNEELIQISQDSQKEQIQAATVFYSEIISLLLAKKHSKKQVYRLVYMFAKNCRIE